MGRYLRKVRPFNSLRNKIIFVFLLLVLPICVMLVYYNFYAAKVIRNQVAHSNENVLSMYMDTLDRELEDTDKYLYNLIAKEPDLLILDASERTDPETYNLAHIRLYNKLANDAVYYDKMEMFFVYSQASGDLITAQNPLMLFAELQRLKTEIPDLVQSDKSNFGDRRSWFIYQGEGAPSLYRMIRYGNVVIGALMGMDQLMTPFGAADLGKDGRFVLVDERGQAVLDDPIHAKEGLRFDVPDGSYRIAGGKTSYMIVSKSSRKGDFHVAALIHERQIMENMPQFRQLVIMIAVATVIVLPIVFLVLRHIVMVPMQRLVSAMRRIRSGDWEVRIESQAASDEFAIVNETFNTMAKQIKELKIHVYEEQLHNQKTELKHLQLQINPHFFLNSLNIIYQLAQVHNFSHIQEMSLSLVRHFRYMFRSNASLVALKDEIAHTQNYLTIQRIRFPDTLDVAVTVEDPCMGGLVPPLICQTFVENAIKHAVSMDGTLHISIKAYVDWEDASWMWLDIRDNGKGFDEDVLTKLDEGIDLGDGEGNHIGIWNIRRRVRLLYAEEEAGIYFSNAIDRGAVVQVRLPIIYRDTERSGA